MHKKHIVRFPRAGTLAALTLAGCLAGSWPVSASVDTALSCGSSANEAVEPAEQRGIRFRVSADFTSIDLSFNASEMGRYHFDLELRRSGGFTGTPLQVLSNLKVIAPADRRFSTIRAAFDRVVVPDNTEFTLRVSNISGPGELQYKTRGPGSNECQDVGLTANNQGPNPPAVADPAGFRVLLETPAEHRLSSAFGATIPTVDGEIGFGEYELNHRLDVGNGYISARNDNSRLYLLLNLMGDQGNDEQDDVWISFDVNRDGEITPHVDLNFRLTQEGNLRAQRYLGPGQWTAFDPVTRSSRARGFGCHIADGSLDSADQSRPASCTAHRVWEFGIDLAEIGAKPGDTLRVGIRTRSSSPQFDVSMPSEFTTSFTEMVAIDLSIFEVTPIVSGFLQPRFNSYPIEITQAIQTITNDMPLVDSKDTVARVYATDILSSYYYVYLYASTGGVDLPGSPLSMLTTLPASIDREDIEDSIEYALPNSWAAGTVDFHATLSSVFAVKYAAASGTTNVAFEAKDTPTYWIVPVNFGSESAPVLPSDSEIDSQELFARTVFPVADIDFVRWDWDLLGLPSSNTLSSVIDDVNDLYDLATLAWAFGYVITGGSPFDLPDQIYGFTPSLGGLSDPLWYYGNGHAAAGYRGTSREGTMAHELNHNLDTDTSGTWGRHVPYGCDTSGSDPSWPYTDDNIQDVGFDTVLPWVDGTGSKDTVIPSEYPDFMSYCQSDDIAGYPSGQLPTKWISTYRWENLFAAAPAGFASKAAPAVADVFYLRGELFAAGGGKLAGVVSAPGIPTSDTIPGEYRVEFLNANNQPLLVREFAKSFVDVEGNAIDSAHFHMRLPAEQVPTVAKVVLAKGATILDSIDVSSAMPELNMIYPNGGEQLTAPFTVQWAGSDANGDSLSYALLYSPDGGSTWAPVANRLNEAQFTVHSTRLSGSDMGVFRVIATDGFNTVTDDTDQFFSITRSAPSTRIRVPVTGTTFDSGATIRFSAVAMDAEDGNLPDSAFVWSFGNSTFGIGSDVEAVLPDGSHTISVQVKDSDGMVNTALVDILVGNDTDGDGIDNDSDNCTAIANPDQRDTDNDGIGNYCDPDFDNNCMVNFADLSVLKSVFFSSDPDADLDGDGSVNFLDLVIFKQYVFDNPGPAAPPNACLY